MNSRVRDAYAARAAEYTAVLGSISATSPIDQGLIREWASTVNGRVVDAGCGPGHWTAFLHELGVEAEGIDPVPEFIDLARIRFPGVPFRLASFSGLIATEGHVAGILAWYSLIHLAIPPTAAATLRPAVAPATEAGTSPRSRHR